MKAAALFAVMMCLTGVTASAHDMNAAAPGAGLLQGDKFPCSPTIPGASTAGQKYMIKSMHPIADPAHVRLTNDQGEEHKMSGAHVREYFRR